VTPETLRESIVRRVTSILKECEQVRVDTDYWNELHPDEVPLDAEWATVGAHRARAALAAIKAGKLIPELNFGELE
jgi:hypothetical protein